MGTVGEIAVPAYRLILQFSLPQWACLFSFGVSTEKAEHLDPQAVSKTDTGVPLETADFIKNALLFEFEPKLV